MKSLLVLCTLLAVAWSQRPPYAGPRQPYPQPHPWFTSSTVAPAPGQGADLGDRAGFTTPSTTTQRLPIDAHGDRELFNQIGTWPREKWPYWYLNWHYLEQARNQSQPVQNGQNPFASQPVASRSSFIGGQ